MAAFDDDVAPQASRGLSFLPQRDAAPSPTIVRQSAGSGGGDGAALATLIAEAQRFLIEGMHREGALGDLPYYRTRRRNREPSQKPSTGKQHHV